MDNPFWDYSVAIYGQPGVSPICLALQDRVGLDVNLLLYAGWLAGINRHLSHPHLASLEQQIAQWRDSVVRPLRLLREQLRDYPQADAVREGLKALELESERQQQDTMYVFYCQAQELPVKRLSVQDNLELVAMSGCREDDSWRPGIAQLSRLL